MPSPKEIRQQITDTIIKSLESNELPPWRCGWRRDPNAGIARNIVSQKAYRGINPWLCQIASHTHGFQSKWWGTFNQWRNLQGSVQKRPSHVKPGEWGTKIVFWSPITKTKTDEQGNETENRFFMLKTFTIFNIDQIDGNHLDDLRVGHAEETGNEIERYENAEAVIAATKADIRFGSQAFYQPEQDFIQLPERHSFESSEAFYETAFHELAHWTEHESRLNWDRSKPENSYALGELIAELSSCFLMGELGLATTEDLTNHSAYVKGWLKAMKNDVSFVFRASGQANKAVDYLLNLSDQPVEEPVLAV